MQKDNNNIPQNAYDVDERIMAYLKEEMSTEEEAAFMRQLESDKELKDQAIAMARLVKGMKDVGLKRDQEVKEAFLSATKEEIEELSVSASAKKRSKTVPLRQLSTWMSIAASVIFIVWIGWGYNDYRQTVGLANEYADAFGVSMIGRGEEANSATEQELAQLFDNIKTKTDMKATLHELSLCWELSTMETYNDYTEYAPEIGWNLAIGYLKNNDKKKAKVVLEKLIEVSEDGSTISSKAVEILKLIE